MKFYMICSLPRSGTHLLKAYLHGLKVGNPLDFYVPEKLESITDIESLMKDSFEGSWSFIVLFSEHLSACIERLKELSFLATASDDFTLLNTLFPDIKFIHYCRVNKIKQAISLIKAERTRAYTKYGERFVSPAWNKEFCRDEILDKVNYLSVCEAEWLNFFDRHYITPHVLTYEELCRDPVTTLEMLLRFLELEYDDIENLAEALADVELPTPQYDEINEQWYQRYFTKEC